MRRKRSCLGVVCVLALALAPTACLAATPLAWVATRDLAALDATLTRLLAPWGLRFAGVAPTTATLVGAPAPLSGPAAVGLFATADGELSVAGYLPIDDVAAIAERLDADEADGRYLARVVGVEVVFAATEGGVVIAGDAEALAAAEVANDQVRSTLDEGDVVAQVSAEGLEGLAEWAHATRDAQPGRAPGLDHLRFDSLTELWRVRDRFAAYAPLARRLAQTTAGLTLSLTASDGEEPSLDARLRLRWIEPLAPSAVGDEPTQLPATETLCGDRQPVLTFETGAPLPEPLVRLALAASESRPDAVEARRYEPVAYSAYADAATRLVTAARACRLVDLAAAPDKPLAGNQALVVRFTPKADPLRLTREMAVLWNEAVAASDAATPLALALEATEHPAGEGLRLKTDVVAAFGGDAVEGLRPLFTRLYGENGAHVVEMIPLGDDRWLFASLPAEDTQALAERIALTAAKPQVAPLLATGSARVDRWVALNDAINSVGLEDAIGRKVRPPMAEAPAANFSLRQEGDEVVAELRVPEKTLGALAAYWRAEKVPAK